MKVPGIPFHQGRNQYSDRDGKKFGIAIHNTSNTASDTAESLYADHRTDGTSSHFYVDKDSVTQSIDTNYRVGHAGSYEGNEHAIAFEITGTNDKSREWWLNNVAWSKLAYVISYMLKHDPDLANFQIRRASVSEMKANPRIKAFYSHNDMRLAWGGTTHTDPGPNFPWDKLIASVKAAMNPTPVVEDDMPTADEVAKAVWGQDLQDPTDKSVHNASDYLRYVEYNVRQQIDEKVKPELDDIKKKLDAILTRLNETATPTQ